MLKKAATKQNRKNRQIIEMEISREINVYNKYLVMYLSFYELFYSLSALLLFMRLFLIVALV